MYKANKYKVIKKTSELIKQGEVVILPSETVYGIGANACSHSAIKKVFELKKRPYKKPLTIHYDSIEQIEKDAFLNDYAYKLAKHFWPGPMTLILNKKLSSQISSLAMSNTYSISVRIPDHPVLLDVLRYSSTPIAMSSANMHQKMSTTNLDDAIKSLGDPQVAYINGDESVYGIESTVLDCRSEKFVYVVRYGSITTQQIKEVLGYYPKFKKISTFITDEDTHRCINKNIRLNANDIKDDECLLSFGKHKIKLKENQFELNLSKSGSLEEARRNLFSYLHRLDRSEFKNIAVTPMPKYGIGIAINDRLEKVSLSCSITNI